MEVMASDRSRGRKVGDATMERIDDLAGGWAVKQERTEPVEKTSEAEARGTGNLPKSAEGSDVIRTKRPSAPPPPPGRKKRPTAPPPPPPGRKKRLSGPPPPPPGRKKEISSPPPEPVAQPPMVAGFIDSADAGDDEEVTVHQPPTTGELPSERGRKVGNTTGTLRVAPALP